MCLTTALGCLGVSFPGFLKMVCMVLCCLRHQKITSDSSWMIHPCESQLLNQKLKPPTCHTYQFQSNTPTHPFWVVATQIFFIFTPNIGEDTHFDSYFSKGLKPPTNPLNSSFFSTWDSWGSKIEIQKWILSFFLIFLWWRNPGLPPLKSLVIMCPGIQMSNATNTGCFGFF